MERLRKTFTCLILMSALFGTVSILVSCHQADNKTKTATTGVAQTAQPVTNQTGQPANPPNVTLAPGPQNPTTTGPVKKLDHPVVLDHDFKKNPNNPNTKLLNNFSKLSVDKLGPVQKVNISPEQKKAQELFQSGSQKSNDGDQDAAIQDFTESINLYKMPIAYLKRGFAELMKEDYSSALNDMNETLKLNPNFERAYFGRGVCRFEMKDFKSAEEDMNKFIAKDKTTAMAYNYLAGCRFMLQDYKGALENYDMVVKLDPKYPDVFTNRGMMKHYLNDLKGAIADYDQALTLDPKNATAYNNRGGAKLNRGDSKAALVDFDKAIELKDDYSDAYDNRGNAYNGLGNYKQASEDLNRAI